MEGSRQIATYNAHANASPTWNGFMNGHKGRRDLDSKGSIKRCRLPSSRVSHVPGKAYCASLPYWYALFCFLPCCVAIAFLFRLLYCFSCIQDKDDATVYRKHVALTYTIKLQSSPRLQGVICLVPSSDAPVLAFRNIGQDGMICLHRPYATPMVPWLCLSQWS